MDVTIFGEHEQRVIDQLNRCVAQEEGSRGVLCADGHLGYSAPILDWEAARRELRELGIELRGAAADEAPGAYKRLGEVLAAHEGTVKVLQELRPLGVAMARLGNPRSVEGLIARLERVDY